MIYYKSVQVRLGVFLSGGVARWLYRLKRRVALW